ncbi:MAG: hypothetical protein LUG57_00805, partial [Oscillospiraceae bacterium]|nr:hypothetical protein [Oscillospiraceae bacterium]
GMDTIINGCSPIAIAWKEGTAVTPIATATATASPASTAPSTGDDSHLFLWLALAAVCACGLAAPAVIGRKREKE